MKIRMPKTWNPMADTYQLTKQEIESQVLSDLAKYKQQYNQKYQKPAPSPLDVDNYVHELWGFDVVFEVITQKSSDTEILGFLRPEARQVVVSENCKNKRRTSFTIAHEAGHLSLHGPLFATQNGAIVGWNNPVKSKNKKKLDTAHIRREWQADVYAGTLLAPKIEIEAFLRELGVLKDDTIVAFNLDSCFSKFEERFGLSRQALEIRLTHLDLPFNGAKYQNV